MAGETLYLDPTGEATGTQVAIDGTTYVLLGHSYPTPARRRLWASSPDTEGDLPVDEGSHENRVIEVTLRVAAASDAALLAAIEPLQQKVGKFMREGGTFRRVLGDGSTITFDVLDADIQLPSDKRWMQRQAADVVLRFVCRPFGRGAEVDLGDNVETTLPCLVFTETAVPGDVPGLGRLVIDHDGTIAWWGVFWGVQSRYYSADASAALFFQAEGRTAMAGSTLVAGPAGASGTGSNVLRNTSLLTSYQAVMSTQATGGGAHLSHIGTFRVWARVQVPTSNTGTVSVCLEWGEGDFSRFAQNSPVSLDAAREGAYCLVDLGLASPRKVVSGTQRWEGRVLAKSTVSGDDIDIDTLELEPVDEGSGIAEAVATVPAPTALSARDEFTGMVVAATVNARVAPTGGTWATTGGTDFLGHAGFPADGVTDMVVSGGTGTRFAILGSTNFTTSAVAVGKTFCPFANTGDNLGVTARYVDTSNYLAFRYSLSTITLEVVVAGTSTVLATVATSSVSFLSYVKLVLAVSAAGDVSAGFYDGTSGVLLTTLKGSHSSLATGGALATGKPGMIAIGSSTSGGPYSKYYDDFVAWVPPIDAGVFGGQSLQVRHDSVYREDSGGTLWQPPSAYEGDYLKVPPAGQEARTLRAFVRPIYHPRTDGVAMDDRIDDLSARLFVTPRYLVVPEP